MRLRDSYVGRAGHYVELEVSGFCPDEDLALIERVAREADTRPIVVRRARGRLDLPPEANDEAA